MSNYVQMKLWENKKANKKGLIGENRATCGGLSFRVLVPSSPKMPWSTTALNSSSDFDTRACKFLSVYFYVFRIFMKRCL